MKGLFLCTAHRTQTHMDKCFFPSLFLSDTKSLWEGFEHFMIKCLFWCIYLFLECSHRLSSVNWLKTFTSPLSKYPDTHGHIIYQTEKISTLSHLSATCNLEYIFLFFSYWNLFLCIFLIKTLFSIF